MGIREMADSRGPGTLFFDPDKIKEMPGYNVRNMASAETIAHIDRMVAAIMAGGTEGFPPITVRLLNDEIFVVAGHCRVRAFKKAKALGAPIKGVVAMPEPRKAEAELTFDLLNSNDGLPLLPLEKAQAVKRLVSFQWSVPEIARRMGCSDTAINNLLFLLDIPAETLKLVEDGKVSATLAIKTVRKEGELLGTEKLKRAVTSAAASGNKRVTAKHVDPVSVQKQVDDNKYRSMLVRICTVDADHLADVIFEAKSLLNEEGVMVAA